MPPINTATLRHSHINACSNDDYFDKKTRANCFKVQSSAILFKQKAAGVLAE